MMKNNTVPVSSGSVIREFIKKAMFYKVTYIICFFVFMIIALFVNKFTNTVYEANASILLVDNNRNSLLSSNDFFRGMDMLRSSKNLDNEISMLSSFSLVSSTINNLNLVLGTFKEEQGFLGIRQEYELFEDAFFRVELDKSHVQPIDVNMYIEVLSDSTFRLFAEGTDVMLYNYVDNAIVGKIGYFTVNSIHKFNKNINTHDYSFTVKTSKKYVPKPESGTSYYFKMFHLDYLTLKYLENIKVEAVTPLSSIINITYRGENLEKIKTFLNKYLDIYLNANLDKKNKASVNTIHFIDTQISQISDSLNSSESRLRDYRSANQVTDLSFQGQRLYDQMTQLETQMTSLEVQKRYYNYVIEYLQKNKDVANIVPPSSMNVTDPIMNQYITDLITLNSERAAIINGSSTKNLFLGQIENKIRSQKEAISENVQNNLNTLNLSINELKYRYNKLTGEISRLPRTETRLVGIERKFKLNDAIYTFLLQKRAEAEIERASNYPDYEILNPARPITAAVVAPKKTINLLVAFLLAMLLPSIAILLRDFFNDKIEKAADVENISQHKVIGSILRNRHKSEAIVAERPRSSVAESFRKLRTNLLIRPMGSSPTKVLLITSSMPMEGKSFITFNLAASIASIGYRTLVIDFDLRKPVLHNKFNIDNTIGLSNFLVNKASIEDIVVKTFVPNLFFVPAGPLLPNPSELIEAGACDKLFGNIRSNYDFILIDTPPLGAVTDSYLLMKYATRIILVARQHFTKKDIITDVVKGLENNNLTNYELVLNDVNYKKNDYSVYYDEERSIKRIPVNANINNVKVGQKIR